MSDNLEQAIERGHEMFRRGADREVADHLRAWVVRYPKHAGLNHLFGLALCQSYQFEEALPVLLRASASAPANMDTVHFIAIAQASLGNANAALATLAAVADRDPEAAAAYAELGGIFHHLCDSDRSLDCLEKAVSLAADHDEHWLRLGLAYNLFSAHQRAIGFLHMMLGRHPLNRHVQRFLVEAHRGSGDDETAKHLESQFDLKH